MSFKLVLQFAVITLFNHKRIDIKLKNCKRYIVLFLCIIASSVSAQTAIIDSLHKNVYAAKNDQQKLEALLALCEQYQSLQRDSLDLYAPEVAELAAKSNNKKYKSLAALVNSNWYQRWGWADSALAFLEPEFSKNPVDNSETRDIYFKISRAKAMSLGSKSRLAEALEVLYKMLPEAEKYKDTLTIGLTCNTIGSITIARQQPKEAIAWMQRAIDISGKSKRFEEVLAPAYLNMANAYVQLGKPDAAEYYIHAGLPLCQKIQNLYYTATALRIQANIYKNARKYPAAEKALLEMMAIRKKINPENFFVEDNLQLADFYANSGQIEKAIAICEENLNKGDLHSVSNNETRTFNNDPKIRMDYLEVLAQYYKQANKLTNYQSTLEELIAAKDSFYAANSAEAIAELQTKYDVQKKEITILQQKIDLQRQNFMFYGLLLLTSILIIAGVILFSNYRKKQLQKTALMMLEEKKQAGEAIKKAEEKERVRIASDLHDNLGAYAAALVSNINYIDIPDTDEKNRTALAELAGNSNAIISQLNDTIWVLKKDALNLTAISDRIKNFIAKINKSYPDMQIEVSENIETDHLLPSSQAFHLYSIIQEAINNALKHSKGNFILVKFEASGSWTVTIQDNGNGLQGNERTKNSGNGLSNMKRRSDEAGWYISWTKRPDEHGTLVTIHSAAAIL
ncbi:MAG: histidine kinase [Ferruginibacter sp.]